MTHKCLEADFSDKKTNLLQNIIKNNDENKEYNLKYLKDYFFSPINLPQLPQFKKKLQISYLQTDKDHSKIKNLIMKHVEGKKNVFRKVIQDSIKAKEQEENYILN